jgi:molybdopterin synthase catalytic subunit
MATWHPEIVITTSPLQSPANVLSGRAGAAVDFWGAVRALEDGGEITGIEYEAHTEMAQHQMEMIAKAAQAEFGLEQIILQHRIGFVAAGEASLFLRVTSAHRSAAYQGSAWIVAELKQKVPIWKRPVFGDQKKAVSAK